MTGRCVYCGAKCKGRVCKAHADLPAKEPKKADGSIQEQVYAETGGPC